MNLERRLSLLRFLIVAPFFTGSSQTGATESVGPSLLLTAALPRERARWSRVCAFHKGKTSSNEDPPCTSCDWLVGVKKTEHSKEEQLLSSLLSSNSRELADDHDTSNGTNGLAAPVGFVAMASTKGRTSSSMAFEFDVGIGAGIVGIELWKTSSDSPVAFGEETCCVAF